MFPRQEEEDEQQQQQSFILGPLSVARGQKTPGTQCFAKGHKLTFLHNLFSIRSKKNSEHPLFIALGGHGNFAATRGAHVAMKHRECQDFENIKPKGNYFQRIKILSLLHHRVDKSHPFV